MTAVNTLGWVAAAACRGYDLEAFFTDSKRGVQAAKQVCARCPVRQTCLEEVLRAEDAARYGIYGGLTPDERTQLVKNPPPAAAPAVPPPPRTGRKIAPCGTRSAYQRHVKKREPIDDACRIANTSADRLLRTTGSTKART